MKQKEVKELANKLLSFLANRYPHNKHCTFIEEKVCNACEEKYAITKFFLKELK